MANGLTIDAKELLKGAAMFDRLVKELPDRVSDVLNANAFDIDASAKRAAPADRGQLRQTISADNSKPLEKHITANAPYAAYVEFGTGKLAAQYVGSLPANYKAYAALFQKGQGFPPIQIIKEWVLRKGIAGKGNSKKIQAKAEQMAFLIARSIFIKGIHPHPFMIPAVIDQQPKIIKDMQRLLSTLK